MKKHALFISLVVATCAAAPLSGFAQERHEYRGGDQHQERQEYRGGDQHADRDRHDDHDNGERRNDRGHYANRDEHDHDRGAGPRHDWRRGQRIPMEYRSNQYVVDDWRGHRLSAPPRGYHWVQAGGDYVLVAVASGIIANVLLNH